ncbi:MAG: ATP-binding protein, partial [Ignavibacteria bacterium]|nr:ATP-binding protein [Ignavibacteria bacterium]
KENIELSGLDINLLCKDLLKQHRLNTKKPKIQFIDEFEEESLIINSNFRMIREALVHLLNNAETFTEEGFILLKTYKNNVPGSGAKLGVIEVIDTGIGIPIEKLNVVFEEFRQASEGFARNYEGIGLGLTLTKKYIELMGGSISVVSQPGTGTKFTLSFPIIEQAEIKSSEIKELKSKEKKYLKSGNESKNLFKNKRILIVEDDEMNKMYLKKCFANICPFEIASTGEQAIKSSSENRFDLILMDINLGRGINGITAVQVIRQMDGYEKTPIVAMTAYASNEAKQEFLSKGCSHFISKPFLMKDIIALVTEIFSGKSLVLNNVVG